MNKPILSLLFLFITLGLQAQDIILTNSGDELKVKVTDITSQDIIYKQADSLHYPVLTIAKASVFLIKYADGTKNIITPSQNSTSNADPKTMYQRGRTDARQHYRGTGAFWGSAATALAMGLPGPIIIGAVPPKLKFTEDMDTNLVQNTHYVSGYKAEAYRRKIGKAATGGALGIGIGVVLISMLVSAGY